jgi:uncharacterized protein YecE (DUF72 family)
VPEDFVFALKASRFLTHVKRLSDPEPVVQLLLDRARPLRSKTGAVLVQLPPPLARDDERLERFLSIWPDDVRLAMELRHRSWLTDDVLARLAARDVALVLSDRDGRPQEPLEATASWGYLRLHHGAAAPRPCYGDRALRSWVQRCRSLWNPRDDVFVYFNNDAHGCAVRDAARFAELAAREGLAATRTADRRAVRVG